MKVSRLEEEEEEAVDALVALVLSMLDAVKKTKCFSFSVHQFASTLTLTSLAFSSHGASTCHWLESEPCCCDLAKQATRHLIGPRDSRMFSESQSLL